jgi:hypothetical protein
VISASDEFASEPHVAKKSAAKSPDDLFAVPGVRVLLRG